MNKVNLSRMLSRDHFNLNPNYAQSSNARFLPTMNQGNRTQGNQINANSAAMISYNQQFSGNSVRPMQERSIPSISGTSSFRQTPNENQINSSMGYNKPGSSNIRQMPEKNIPGTSYVFATQVFNGNKNTTYCGPSTSKMATQRHDQGMSMQLSRPNTSTNTSGVMATPRPTYYSTHSTASATRTSNISQTPDSRIKMKQYGETEQEKLCILTGTVERVIKYGRIFQNHFCYFQVIGSVVSIASGKVQFEKTMLLRDKKGPILQLTYYSNATHIHIDDFHLGQNLRAVGRMIGPNVMSAVTIRAASTDELDILPRMCYISDYALSTLCGDTDMPSNKA